MGLRSNCARLRARPIVLSSISLRAYIRGSLRDSRSASTADQSAERPVTRRRERDAVARPGVVTRSVLLTDGEQRSTLAATRSLGKAGHSVHVCSSNGRSLAGASRFAKSDDAAASSLATPAAFVRDLASLIAARGIDVVIPMTEQAFNAIYANPSVIPTAMIPAANAAQFAAISDKARVADAAAACGLRVPEQIIVSNGAELRALPDGALGFPVVLKPARSVVQVDGRQVKLGVTHCRDRNALERVADALPESAFPLLIQRRIIGPGMGIFLLVWDGELVARFAHRRLREKPPAGGVSVYRESIAPDPTLLAKSQRLLEHFSWRGVAMIEYKLDAATGIPYIMEINGRFWGSLQLAIDSGVDFPSLLVARHEGTQVFGPAAYRAGIRSRWEWGEVDHLLARLRRTDAQLSLPPDSPSRARALLTALVPWRPGDRFEVFRASDPLPFVRETVQYFRRG